MARLIPRKQIEEQQNISGSLSIQQNVEIGQDAIISGSLFVSKSFFFGNDLNDKSEITGSVFLTGSLVIDGELRTAAPNTILSVTSSNALLAVDTQRYAGILAKDFGANVPTLYVSSTDGDDTNDGRTIQFPLRTIKRAASLAAPGYDGRYGFDTGSISNGYVIKVQAGTYLEDNPVILPKNTTIWGAGLRITKINAKTPTEDLFLVNAGCYIAEVTMGGLRLYPDQINPERGFAVAFQPGAFITTSPYVQNCSQISNQENSFTELYEDIPPGGGGLYVNGDVIDPDSPLASMVLDAYTQISPNGVGCLVNGRGFIQLVSFFNNFSYYAIRVNNGGQATLNNSNISFGLYGMYASGSRLISGSGGNIQARDSVRGTWSCVVDVLNKGLENGLPTITKLNTAEGIRLTAPSLYTQSRVSATTALSTAAADEISSDYTLISEIVDKGVSNFPTLLAKSSIKGYGFDSPYNILGAEQITSSISATQHDLNSISASYAAILSILANGTGSFTFKSNTSASKQIGTDVIEQITNIATNYTASVSSSFGTVLNIITKGVSVKPTYIANASGSIKGGTTEQIMLGVTSSLATINSISASFSIVYNILANGTGSNVLPIPANHQKSFVITNNNSSSFDFEGLGSNPTLTLFRGETYKFNVNAIETFGGIEYPFWIRTEQLEGITERYDYNIGMVNNGDSRGTITFTVPYNAPNRLYYVSQNRSLMGGKIEIVNSSTTPFDLIKNTLTYPATIQSGSIAKTNIDIVTAYEILVSNIEFIKDEVIQFVSSSWSGFSYPEETCKRDVGYIVNGVAKDLLFGGNEESIRNGLFYYQYPSEATTTQLGPTLTAMKHAAGVSLNLIRGKVYTEPTTEADDVWNTIRDNKTFVQNEVITYLSSSWSNFYYNEAKCRRDTGYILDAVATDAKYGGNERSIIAGEYYYQYPSLAIVRGDGDGVGQLGQTSDGIRYASGLVDNLLKKKTFTAPASSTLSAYNNLLNNKELIQNETIQFINVAFPNLKYIQATCRRDVGYIVDNVATDLLYGGIERGVTAGRYYYDYPSLATTTQRTSTIAGVKYAKIIGDTIVQNIILDTPRIVYNDENNFRLSTLTNVTSSFSGSATQQTFIGNTFSIIEGIVARGLGSIKSLLAQNTGLTWNKYNPISVSSGSQITSSNTTSNEVNTIGRNFDIVNTIIGGGLVAEPLFTASQASAIAVTGTSQTTASLAVSGSVTSSISASFGYVATIITNGTGSLGALVSNLNSNVKVTNTSQYITGSSYYGTNTQSTQLSSSIKIITDILEGGLSFVPALTSSVSASIKVTNASQYISASYSASASNVNFISSSISIVTKIIEGGEFSAPAFQTYTNRVTSSNSVAAYEILKNNIPFIVSESIAYLSSSWAGFAYDESKCKRDLGFILSGSAEDLIWNANSASVFNGLFYWEFPSQAQGAQLQQTLDGINYASRLAQKVIQNIEFNTASANTLNAASLLVNNKVFIQDETIAYLSSSWSEQAYIESTCKRDVGHVIDAIRTDLVYGGNERSRNAGIYYYQYPSQATGSQLLPTLDGINYAGRMIQKIVTGSVFVSAEGNKVNASNLILRNKNLIANEVVAYVSSSWSTAEYNQAKCLRDTKYILDAVRTDLVYGGNERTRFAGEYYYRYPSAAIVGGVPSITQQLDPTITGVNYANQLVQNIIKNIVLSAPSTSVLNAASLLKTNRAFLQQNTVDYANETYPNLDYIESKCYRDTGFIVDAVITDLVYGGNERSITAGRFYYLYPSQATGVQSEETIDSLNFTKGLAKLVAIGGKSIEDGFDIVANVIESGSNSAPNVVLNTAAGIKATTAQQITSSISVGTADKSVISSSFGNILNILSNGTGSIPTTIVKNTNKGVKVLDGTQITSSNTPATSEKIKVTTGFDTVLDIVENGTGSIPTIVTNVNSLIRRTATSRYITTASIASTYLTASNNSFDIVLDIVENGTGSLPILVKNTDSLVKITNTNQYTSSVIISSSIAKHVSGSFDKIINILENGTGSLPTIVTNVNSNIKVTNATQYFGVNAATQTEANAISASISIVTNIIANGTGSLPTVTLYTSSISSSNVVAAYTILKSNLDFIVSESIAYLSSSWSTASYDESKCRRDLKGILSGSAEDLIFNANSASVFNGKFYYQFPSQAQGAQLNQTLDGIKYASRLAQKLVLNTLFVTQSAQVKDAYTLLVNNKEFIKDEVIPYISSSWSTHQYVESTCKRDIVHIIDAVSTDLLYGGNERTINAGVFYYKYPSEATGSQIQETVTGIEYARNLAFKILRGNTFVKVSQNKLQAKELIYNNRAFIQNEVISYISASWSTASYNETTCKRDVGHILDAVTTDIVYGGNERSINAGKFYYEYPSQATTSQLGPTLSGIKYAKDLTNKVLINSTFVSASNSNVAAYELIFNNKSFIQNETIAYLSSSWSAFSYNQTTCKRDIGYILDAVATDILYGGNERVAKAGEYYYLYPSLATVGNDGDTGGQLNQTLDGIKYAKGITEKIVANLLLQSPTTSELTGFNLLIDNKKFIQSESIAYLSSSWSGGDGFYYNETTCKRDIGHIIDAVRTDLVYGGNERSSKAGEYYYLYPSAAILTGSVSPTAATQKGPTLDGIKYVAGTAENIIANKVLISPTGFTTSSVNLLRQNKKFIQNETVQYIDAFFPNLVYLRETCRRDVGYILDAVITDTFYGGNQRSVIAGQYYYLYPSLATKSTQVRETVAGVDYAKALAKAIVQNIKLNSPTLTTNTDGNIKVTNTVQYTSSSISASIIEVNQISSSFGLVTGIINDGVKSFTPTTATYNPANGEFVITIPSHTLTKYNSIYIRPESFVFTCEMDGNRTEHKLPGVGQYPYSNKLQIQSVTTNTITVNVGASGPNVEFTPTSASYNPATGNFVVTVGTHNLSVGEGIVLSTGSFAFTCDMDNNQSTKSYPRFGIDPYSVRSIPLTAVTDTTLTFNVGVSAANKYFTPTSASYNALTGDMVVTVGQHGLGVGRSVTLASASIAFTCDQDNNATTHSYPRSGSDPYAGKSIVITSIGTSSHTITNAPYNSSTGVVTLTVVGHGFSNGDYIKISDNSLTYTCVLDDYSVSKSYPRPGYDYPSGRWLEISNVTTNTFTINVGSSNYIGAHTFVSATANGLQRQTGTFTINVGDAGSASGSIHTFVSASANAIQHLPQSVHTFVSASAGAIKHLPQSAHTFVRTTKNSISTIPVLVQNGNGLIKVTNTAQYSSSISASGAELDIITSSFKHVADIIENGVAFVPDSLARNYDYGFELSTPTLLHISSKEQTIGTGSYNLSTQITNVSSSYGIVVNVVKNGLSVLPTLVASTSSSLKVTNANPIKQSISASSFDTNKIASGFDLILNVIENGTSVLPTITSNTSASIKVTNTPQLISGSASGRLQGKLISSSLSLVIDVLLSNGTSSIGYKPSTYPIANSNAKINSAYNLLVSNSKFIVDETIAYMSSSWSGFEYTQSKCERDLTGILSGSAFDLLYGGNSASLFNGKFYFDYPSQATGSQLDQTITAIKYASGLAEKVVLNTVFTHISASINQPTSASWNSLRTNKGFIQSESIAYLSSSWSNFGYNETTCKRDIGYVIDAVATDLLYGGNERSVVAGRYYYDYPSQATNAQLEPTLTGIRYAKGTAMNVVVNKQIFTASLEAQYAYDLIKANKLFIQSESVAYVNVKYPNLDYSESKCYRDLGYIIDGVATDLLYGGNERSRDNADYYYQFPSQANGFGSQVIQTTDAIKYAARFTTASIGSTLIAAPSIILNTLGNIKVTNALQYISASSATSTEATILSASIAIVTNIVANGTGSAIVSASLSLPTSSYTTAVSNDNRWIAYGILKNNISFIQDETIAYLSSSWSTASYDESKCRRDVGLIISGAAEDLVFNSNSASLFNGIFYYQYPSQAQGAQLNQTLDGINYASKLAQKVIQNVTYVTASAIVSASYALIRKNREFIQNETIAYLSSSWSTASYIESTCKRDVGHIIDAVSTDLLYGGNERSTNAGVFYYLYPSQAQGAQLQPTLTGVNYAGQLSKNVAASLTFVTASQLVSASVNLLRKNKEFIQNETLAYLTASWSTFEYDKDKCKRDTGYILDGVTTDLLYGGNERGVLNGKFYYEYPSLAIVEGDGDGVGQLGQTIDGINYAGRIAQKIVKNIVFQTASLQASASFDLLRKNKAFIAEETIAYVSSSWSGVYYNQTTCKRDVGYLIDAAATDVLYGGQERSVIAGQYYYLYPSNAINKGVPSTQNQLDPTLTGIRYAGKIAKKVVINPTYLEPSASLITTAKLLTDNKQLIQKETITFLSSSWSNLKYNEASCSRDLGFIIDAIRTDLVYGGNERSIEAGSYYYKFPSVAIVDSYGDNNGQKKQTIDGINFARGISEKIVANTLLTYLAPSSKRRQAAERVKGGKEELKQRAIGYTNGAFPYLVYNEASCSRDTGFIVDACVTDLLYGGNERGIRAASSYYDGQYGSAVVVTRDQLLETLETNRYLRTRVEFIAAGAPLEVFGSLIVATGIDYSYNGSGVTFKALPPNQGGSGVANPIYEITELGGGRIYFTSGNQDGDFRIGTGLSINQATGTLVGRTFSKSLFSLVTPFSLALQI
jgi:hypothetical protein